VLHVKARTLIHTDRISPPGPTRGVDLWWSGKHHHHAGNIQVVSAPDGWPLWTSDVRPGREHDINAARADPDLPARIADWISDGAPALADLGYEGQPETFTIPFKKPKYGQLSIDQQAYNAIHGALRCLGARANSLLKTTTRPCAATAAVPGASATSRPPPWFCSITNTAGPHDQTEDDHTRLHEVTRKAALRS
jgi:hypothetical protein